MLAGTVVFTVMSIHSPESVVISTRDDHPVVADVYLAQSDRAVVLCHGFTGHRRWGFIPYVAQRIADAGIAAVVMDFSHNGHISNAGEPCPDHVCAPELFRRDTVRRECEDLEAVLAWFSARNGEAPRAVGLWGHSRGGSVAVLVALDGADVGAISTWAAVKNLDHFSQRQKDEWREKGALEFSDPATGVPLAVDTSYLDDLEANGERYDLAARVGGLSVPYLIVHGEHDPVVPPADALELYKSAPGRVEKQLLRPQTGHTFGYEDGAAQSKALQEAARATADFFTAHLGKETTE